MKSSLAWSRDQDPNRLVLTKQFPLEPVAWLPVFRPVMLAGGKIWNSCVWWSRKIKASEGRWPDEAELKARFRHFASWRELHSQSAQAVVEDYFEAIRSYTRHRANGHEEMRPPGFKNRCRLRTVVWKRQGFVFGKDTLVLKLSRGRSPIVITLPPGWNIVTLPDGTEISGVPIEVRVKATYRRREVTRLVVHMAFDLGTVAPRQQGEVSAYDYNSALLARTTSTGRADLFILRGLLALVQYRNKALARFQSAMSRCREGSRRWRLLADAKVKMLQNMDARIRQMEHAITKLVAELDSREGVASAVVGDLVDLRKSARSGEKNRVATQKINQMSYDRLQSEQRYKNLMRKVATVRHPERGTSSRCAICCTYDPSSRKYRGLWVCRSCGAIIQADLLGSANLLKLYLPGDCRGTVSLRLFYSAGIWRWCHRLNMFVKVSPRASDGAPGVVATGVTVASGRPSGNGINRAVCTGVTR